jgi:hypothetical protein
MCDRAKELAEFDYDAGIQEASDRLRFQQKLVRRRGEWRRDHRREFAVRFG